VGRAGTACHVESIVRGWRRVDQQIEAKGAARQHAARALHVYQDEDGTVVLRGRLTPEVGALLLRALDAARETLSQRTRVAEGSPPAADPALAPPTRAQQQADALALLAETALHHELDPGAPGERYQVVIHVDAAVLADSGQPGQSVLEEGSHVSAETSRRLTCDASRVVMRHDEDGHVVEIGARTRTIPPRCAGRCNIRTGRAASRAAMCGSARPSRAALGAGRTHHASEDPVEALRTCHDAQGLHLNGRTACPLWLGERLDVGWAINVLHPRAVKPTPSSVPECESAGRTTPT
jgi:hypothetical protein